MNEKELLKLIGYNIRRERTNRALTQKEMAALCGMEKASLSRIEGGIMNITISTLHKVAAALEIKPALLFEPISEK